jgi:hypothetical protein
MRLLLISVMMGLILISCKKESNSPPLAAITFFPMVADTSSLVRFDGSASTDKESYGEMLQFRWDFNGDGIWDTEFKREAIAIWQFSQVGTYQTIMEVRDEGGLTSSDTSKIRIRLNFVRSSFTDPRDGNQYRMVLIDDLWWMAENLRYGVSISQKSITSDNNITEMYLLDSQKYDRNFYGGYYTWGELTNYNRDILNGICPPGWRVATLKDKESLSRFWQGGDASFYFKPDGYLGLDLVAGGYLNLINRSFLEIDTVGRYWVSDFKKTDTYPGLDRRILIFTTGYMPVWIEEGFDISWLPDFWKPAWGDKMDFNRFAFNVRCVKHSD